MPFLRRFSFFLAPSLFSMVVSFVMVPITTYVLGPAAFGVFGLMTAVVAAGWSVSVIGSSAVCSVHFPGASRETRAALVSTMLAVGFGLAALFCLACLGLLAVGSPLVEGYSAVPRLAVALSMLTILLGVPWMVAQEVITLDGRARGFAAVTMAQTLLTALVTVAGLYVFDLGVLALFVSAAVAAATTAVGAMRLLAPYLTPRVSGAWARELARVGPASAWLSLSESLQGVVERAYVASTLGVGALGLYVHALNYRVIVAQVLKAAARPIWPITLSEAATGSATFRQTRVVWDAMYLVVAAAGVTFVLFGREIIGWLTHGRFVETAAVVPYFMILLLVQNAAKPQVGVLFRHNAVRPYYWVQTGAAVVWLGLLVVAVRFLGLTGAALALIGQQLIIRVGVHLLARKHVQPAFTEFWLCVGVGLIVATMFLSARVPSSLAVQTLLWLGSLAVLAGAGYDVIRRFAAEHLPGQAARTRP